MFDTYKKAIVSNEEKKILIHNIKLGVYKELYKKNVINYLQVLGLVELWKRNT